MGRTAEDEALTGQHTDPLPYPTLNQPIREQQGGAQEVTSQQPFPELSTQNKHLWQQLKNNLDKILWK